MLCSGLPARRVARPSASALIALTLVASSACSGRSGYEVVQIVGSGGYVNTPADASLESSPPADAGDSGTRDGDAAIGDAHCTEECDAAQSVGCPNDTMQDCMASCTDLVQEFPACAQLFDTFNRCAAAAPQNAWHCDSDGFAALASTVCAAENDAVQTCFRSH